MALSGMLLLMGKEAFGDHLPPITPVLPGENHQHEDHSGADFSNQDLMYVDFSQADLTGATFEDANLLGVLFIEATLDEANLRGRNRDGANFSGASLLNAMIRGMEGTGVIFTDATLSGADMDDSFFYFSDFRNVHFGTADVGEFTAEDSDFRGADLTSVINPNGTSLLRSIYDSTTLFPQGFDTTGMIMVPEPSVVSLLLAGLFLTVLLKIYRKGSRGIKSNLEV